jgi:hypothetical protein
MEHLDFAIAEFQGMKIQPLPTVSPTTGDS